MDSDGKKVILLVEDEALLALNEKKLLQKYGYSVATRSTGEQAIELLAGEESVDLILMDINLGEGIDGTAAAEVILKDRDIPIVFLSSHVEPEIVAKTEKITSYGYVVKNSSITVLDASIKMAFKLFEARMAEKEKEERLFEHDQYLHSILQTTVDGFLIINMDRECVEVNDAYLGMTGYSRGEFLGLAIGDINAEESFEETGERIALIKERGNLTFETRHRRKDGSVFDVEMSVTYFESEGGKLICFCRDISARRQIYEELIYNEQKFRNLFNNSEVAMFRSRLDGTRMLDLNDKYVALLGRTKEECVGKPSVDLWADPAEREVYAGLIMERGHVEDFECRLLRKDGAVLDCLAAARLYPEQGVIEGSLIDVTDERRAQRLLRESEEALRERERQLTEAQRLGHTGSWVFDVAASSFRGSDESRRIFGLPGKPEGTSQEELEACIVDRGPVRAALTALIEEGKPYDIDYSIRPADGSEERHIHSVASLERDAEGRPSKVQGFIQDISELKRSQAELTESESGLARAERVAKIGNWKLAMDSRQVTASAGACQIYGVAERALSLDLIQKCPLPEYRPLLDEALSALLTKGSPYKVEFKLRRVSDGQVLDIQSIADYDASTRTLYGVIQDITERKLAESSLAALLEEKENLLKEIHHRIKNNMGTMESLLSLQAGIIREPSAVQALNDARNRLLSMGVLYDKLYRSQSFDEVSAREYLPSLLEEVMGVFPNSPLVETRIEVGDFALGTKAMSTLGIILNELVTNVMKHAFPGGRKGLISLEATKAGSRVRLSLADDGVGLPEGTGFESSEGFGLILVATLAKQLGASLEIVRGGGTRFVLEFAA